MCSEPENKPENTNEQNTGDTTSTQPNQTKDPEVGDIFSNEFLISLFSS